MKTQTRILMLGAFAASLLTVTPTLPAQAARFFRISGPAATTITAFRPDGTLVWSNALAGTNYTVQTCLSLPGGTNWVDYVQLPVTNGVNTNRVIDLNPPSGMALIPAGSFTMGDTFNEGESGELPLHTVYVSAFYMDKYDVTYALWQTVYNWATNHGYSFDHAGSGKAANHPVKAVDWYDCVKWCNARSELEGRIPAYYTDAMQTTVYRTGRWDVDNSSVNWNAGYRLPTEAEWEKTARGGASGQRFPWGNTIS
jgi:formylglycine-generating enzyme required for sulfatase activity